MPQPIARPVFKVSVAAIMLFQVAALFARSRLELSLVEHGTREAVAKDVSYLVVPPILLVLMFPYLKRCKAQLLSLFRPSALTWRLILGALLLGLTLRITYWSIVTILICIGVLASSDPNAIAGPLIGFGCPSTSILLLSLGVMAALTPVIEEVINRGFILHALLPRGLVLSVGVSAAFFAFMHPPGTYLTALLIGVLLAIQTLNSGTLWAATVAHASYNAAAVLDWDCFRIVWNPPPSDPKLAVASAIAVPVALLGTCLAIYMVTRRAAGAR